MAVFRLTDHINRLFTSAKVFMIDVPFCPEQIIVASKEVVRVNRLDDGCYLRPIVYLGYGEMGLNPLPCPVSVAIARPWGTYLGDEGVANGIRLKVSTWLRIRAHAGLSLGNFSERARSQPAHRIRRQLRAGGVAADSGRVPGDVAAADRDAGRYRAGVGGAAAHAGAYRAVNL